MAGGQERVLRRRIRWVQATKKITKAMELIAASRIVRAQNRIAANRPYRAGWSGLSRRRRPGDPNAARSCSGRRSRPQRGAILAIVGDRGLAGSYNSGVLRATERLVAEYQADNAEVVLWSVGKKAPPLLPVPRHRSGALLHRMADRPEFVDAREVAAVVAAPFMSGEVDLVQSSRPAFISAGTQRVESCQLLPTAAPDRRRGRGADDGAAGGARRGLHRVRTRAPRNCLQNWPPGPWSPRSSRPCSRARRPSSPPSSGPWRRQPRTRTN